MMPEGRTSSQSSDATMPSAGSTPSVEPTTPGIAVPPPEHHARFFGRSATFIAAVITLLVFFGFGVLLFAAQLKGEHDPASATGLSYKVTSLSLSEFARTGELSLDKTQQLQINGQLRINNSAVITPGNEPSAPLPGQLYMSQADNQLYYFDGTAYVNLADNSQKVTSLGGLSGDIALGSGLSVIGGVLSSTVAPSSVVSVQGLTGAVSFSAGGGIALNGTAISNIGVTGLTGTVGQINVSQATGNVILTLPQSIATSATPSFSGINLASALTVANGGTGGTAFTANGVLLGNGAGGLTATTSGSAGQCFISNGAAAPSFQACPGGGGGNISSGTSQTAGTLTKFDSVLNTITDSLVSEVGTVVTIGGDLSVSGIVSGNGSGLTNVNAAQLNGQLGSFYQDASNLNAGIVSDTRLSTNVTLQGNSFNGANQLVQLNASTQLPAVSGTNLTNLNASSVSSGTLPVIYGGTGANSFAANGVLYGNNTGALLATAAGTTGDCLMAGVGGVPSFQTCPVGGNISSGTSQTPGALTKFDSTTNEITDSLLTETAGLVTASGNFTITGTPTLSALGAGILHSSAAGVVTSSAINLNSADVTNTLQIGNGGTGAITAGAARTNLGAAASGANADITSLSGLTTALSVTQGGTGQNTYTDGQLLIGNSVGNTLTKATLTAGSGVTIVNGNGTITISAPSTGSCSTCANVTLSNLSSPTAINQSLLTDGSAAIDLGSATNAFRDLYLANQLSILESGASPTFRGNLVVSDLAANQTYTLNEGGTVVTSGNVASFATTSVTAGSGLTGGGTTGALTVNVGAGTGIQVNANDLEVLYGAVAGTAVQGNTSITVSAGTNLNGGGAITLGAGGSVTLNTVNNPTFSTSVTTPLLNLSNSGFNGALQPTTLTGNQTYTLPDSSGTVAVSASGNIALSALGNISFAGTLPVGSGGTGQNSYTDGQLLIGNSTGSTLSKSTLTAGSGITIVNGNGSITISAPSAGSCPTCANTALSNLSSVAINTSLLPGSSTIDLGSTANPFRTGYFNTDVKILEDGATPTFHGILNVADLSADQTYTLNEGGTVVTSGNVTSHATTGVTAGSGLTGGGTTGVLTVNIGAGNGITVNPNDITLALQANKGLEVDVNGLSLIDCADTQILKYTTATNQWGCAPDAGGSGVGDDISVNGVNATAANFLDVAATGTVAGTTWSLNTVSNPDDITVAISNASDTQAGVVTTGVQTFAGAKTFNGAITAGAGIDLGAQTLSGTTAVINFTNFDVSSAGAVTAVGLDSGTGLIQGSGGLTVSAGTTSITGTTNINTSGAAATSVGTGTGTLALGNAAGATTLTGSSSSTFVLNGTTVSAAEFNILDGGIDLSTETSGNYVATITAGGGLTGDVASHGSTPTLAVGAGTGIQVNANDIAVLYGAIAGTAVQGNTSITVSAGTNLIGGGSITLGSGGSVTVNTVNNPTFSTSVTTPALILSGGGSSGTLQVASLGQATAYTLPDPGASTATICLSSGNCAGAGGGVTGTGTAGTLAKFTASGVIGDSLVSETGSAVTVSGTLAITGASTVTLGTSTSATGSLIFNNAANGNTLTLQSGATGSNLTFTLPTADGGSGQCLKTNASGVLSFGDCLTGAGGGGGGVASLNGLSGTLSLANASGVGSTVTIDNASTSVKGIAQFNATNFSASAGTINTIQDIATTASPTFDTLTANTELRVLEDGGSPTNYGTLNVATLSADQTYTLNEGGTVITTGNVANNAVTSVSAGDGLTGGGGPGSVTLNVVAGNGITVNPNDVTLALQTNKGLEVDANGLSLIDCGDNQILKYSTGTNQWSCAADAGGSGLGDNITVNSTTATDANFLDVAATGTVTGTAWSINTVSNPDDITIAISNASATVAGAVTTGIQTFAGAKTFNSQITAGAGIDLGAQTIQGTTAVINFTNFDVSSAGAVTAVGVDAGTGLIQNTGGLTTTGTASINTTGTAASSIGNATG
ncbi:MAG TPA: hypothetical protein VF272_03760, partial [Candidatus Saccharimonadia bacterium]